MNQCEPELGNAFSDWLEIIPFKTSIFRIARPAPPVGVGFEIARPAVSGGVGFGIAMPAVSGGVEFGIAGLQFQEVLGLK